MKLTVSNIAALLAIIGIIGGGFASVAVLENRVSSLERQVSEMWRQRASDHDVITGHKTDPDFWKASADRSEPQKP